MKKAVYDGGLKKLFEMANKTKRHNLTPEELKDMDKEVYDVAFLNPYTQFF